MTVKNAEKNSHNKIKQSDCLFSIANTLQNWFLNDYVDEKHQVIMINPQTPLQHLKQINGNDNTSGKNAVNKHCIHN